MTIMIITLQLTLRSRLGRSIDTDKSCHLTPSVLSRIVRLWYDGHLTFPTVHSEHLPGQWPSWRYFISSPCPGHHQPIAASHSGSTTDRAEPRSGPQTCSLFPHNTGDSEMSCPTRCCRSYWCFHSKLAQRWFVWSLINIMCPYTCTMYCTCRQIA